MRAARIAAWGGPLELVEIDEPEPAAGEVLVRVEACGIGLTVLNCIRGDLGADPAHLPRVPGHELVGVIESTGAGVARARVGERVAAYFYLSCGACSRCLEGFEPLCENLGGNIGVACDGGYAELCALPAFNALPLTDGGIEAALATAIPDAVATPVHVAALARIGPRSRVVVIAAAGGVGIHMLQVARAYGADVFGLDAVPEKLALLERELHVPTADSTEFGASLLPAAWREQVDVVVDLLGRPESLEWALRQLAPNGRLVCLTTFRDVEVRVSPRELVLGQAAILGSRYASRHEVGEAAALVASGRVRPIVSRRVRLEDVESVHDELRQGTLLGRAALVWDEP